MRKSREVLWARIRSKVSKPDKKLKYDFVGRVKRVRKENSKFRKRYK